MKLNIDNTFYKFLPADKSDVNTPRIVDDACFSWVNPTSADKPELLHYSEETLKLLGLTKEDANTIGFLEYFSGNKIYSNTKPYAMCYGGHQFGQWAGQLGDGRVINLFEVKHDTKRWTVQLKGAGATPYSRRGDGYAVLRSSIREHLCSEAMYHLGIPTSRSLCIVKTGDKILRDILYDGNAEYEQGAIVTRVAPTFIRFGSFQIFASRNQKDILKQLADYTINQFFPEIKTSNNKYVEWFEKIVKRTMDLIIHWQRVGFVHGVMNTDNMSIIGQTIDYGPYGFLEDFDLNWTPNITDVSSRRYAYGKQAEIALWNLLQLANAIYLLIGKSTPLENALKWYQNNYFDAYLSMMRKKIGLLDSNKEDAKLINELEKNLGITKNDFTIFFRELPNVQTLTDGLKLIEETSYNISSLNEENKTKWKKWFESYLYRIETLDSNKRKVLMKKTNPKYILRNYMAQLCANRAENGDYTLLEDFYRMLKKPYQEQKEYNKWYTMRPDWANNKAGYSMLSCSS